LPFAVRVGVHSAFARVRGGLEVRPSPVQSAELPAERVTFTHGALERRRAKDLDALGRS
jgi:hypothetical protein